MTSPIPPHAVPCWADHLAVYVELPGGRLTFPLTEAGFARALNVLKAQPRPERPLRHQPARRDSAFTADQRTAALRAIRRVA